jgi:RNA-splicing ligase RtcB
MITLNGKYADAKVFTDNVEATAVSQIINLLNQPFVDGSNVRIMPDTHAGAGCVIGFTASMGDKVIPNLVGVDIGCGMLVIKLGKVLIDLARFDKIVHDTVPCGHDIHDESIIKYDELDDLICFDGLYKSFVFNRSIGTLGGGNHFIELDKDDEGNVYLVIHSGSRNLGKQVADLYQKIAIEYWKDGGFDYQEHRKQHKNAHPLYPADLCFLIGQERENYLHDMNICQRYADVNRQMIANIILYNLYNGATVNEYDLFSTIHNYVNFHDNIIRKGAVSAYAGENLIIPMNMRDGSLLCTGKGNADWNYSAPHGAGRLMGRNVAKSTLSMEEFEKTMSGIYSSTVNRSTLDEAPDAYKPMAEIIANIQDTVTIDKIIKPVYNFKAEE